jgi:hypothetical protein
MIAGHFRPLFLAAFGLIALPACQTRTDTMPATLASGDAVNMLALHNALAHAVGRAQVSLMDADLTRTSSVSVLPPPPGEFDTHSMALPVVFDIFVNGDTCMLVRRDTQESYDAPGLACTPAKADIGPAE